MSGSVKVGGRPWQDAGVDERALPRHVACIMDGNGRWAERRGLSRKEGHRAGTEAVRRVIRASVPMGLEALTLYTFSTENWKRPTEEVQFLWELVAYVFEHDLPELKQNNVRVRIIGERDSLPQVVRQILSAAEDATAGNDGLTATFALNYGARDDIARAARRLAEDALAGRLPPEKIDEGALADRLGTAGLPDLDLVVRTGGDMRLSNFLLWEMAYAEFVCLDCLWPDFTAPEFYHAIAEFQRRDRRFGGIPG